MTQGGKGRGGGVLFLGTRTISQTDTGTSDSVFGLASEGRIELETHQCCDHWTDSPLLDVSKVDSIIAHEAAPSKGSGAPAPIIEFTHFVSLRHANWLVLPP